MTEIRCPHCQFSKEVDITALPDNLNKVTCPRCRESFPLLRDEQAETPEIINIPSRQESSETQIAPESLDDPQQEKAGFWIRFVAAIVDGLLVFILQMVLGGMLYLAGALNGSADGNTTLLVEIFTLLLSIFYYIFFTGYCGQTPGKMATRIKVICCDGSQLGYGKAAFRELPAKFISGIILGIGYLMAAFDENKQALHDRMAKTYVIKL